MSLSSCGNWSLNGTLQSIGKHSDASIWQWNSSSSKWVNATVSTGGSSKLAADTDCSISSPATNQALTYNLNHLMLEESSRRIYPVIRDTNNIIIGGWNIQNSSGTLDFNYNSTNELNLSSGGNLSLNGTLPSSSKHSDVSISSLTNNQILQWNSSSSKWVNATVSTGGSTTLAADTDCSISTPATNQALIYNSSSKWANTNLTHNLLTDASITSINNGDILRWNDYTNIFHK